MTGKCLCCPPLALLETGYGFEVLQVASFCCTKALLVDHVFYYVAEDCLANSRFDTLVGYNMQNLVGIPTYCYMIVLCSYFVIIIVVL